MIKLNNISFGYSNNKGELVLEDLDLSFKAGKIVSILGDSGSGKSTILRILAGLEKPYTGCVEIGGVIHADDRHFSQPEDRGVGMVFQDYALFPHMTVKKNILFGLSHLKKNERMKRVKDVLKLVRMEELSERYPHELSGGQQQRVALARAIAPKPTVLLLDEPFSNLDAGLQSSIRQEVKSILNEAKITAIFVTHDQEDALAIADDVVYLKEGRVFKQGPPKSVLV